MGIVNSVYQMFWTPQKPIEDKEEIQGLKNKLRKQKSSTDAATADQVAQLEREITDEWTEKSEKMIKAAEDKHKRTLREMEEEKVQAQQNAKDLEKKVQTLKSSGNESDNQISGLQGRVEELEAWKDKYDKLRSQAGVMKEKYEERIEELEEEVENAKKATTTTPGPAGDSASDVKKIMSSVYHSLRGQLDASDTFTGSQALTIILNTIKSETLKMTSDAKDEESEEVSDDEEEESEDEAEEKPVVMETLSAQTASPTQGAKASKASKSDSPAKKKEDRTMTSIEDDILSQLVGSGMTVTDKKSTSPKKENEIVKSDETLVKASSANITGDKGNKYYSEELDKSKGNEVIKEVIEPAIKSSKDAITGDKGNKYYTEELDKGKQPAAGEINQMDESEEVSNDTDKLEEDENYEVINGTQADVEESSQEIMDPSSIIQDNVTLSVDQGSDNAKDQLENSENDLNKSPDNTTTEVPEQTQTRPATNPTDETSVEDSQAGGNNTLQLDESILKANDAEEILTNSDMIPQTEATPDASKQYNEEEEVSTKGDNSEDTITKTSSAENSEVTLADTDLSEETDLAKTPSDKTPELLPGDDEMLDGLKETDLAETPSDKTLKVALVDSATLEESTETDLTDSADKSENELFKPLDGIANGTESNSQGSAEDVLTAEDSFDTGSSVEHARDKVTVTGEADESSPEDETNSEQTDKQTDKPVESDVSSKSASPPVSQSSLDYDAPFEDFPVLKKIEEEEEIPGDIADNQDITKKQDTDKKSNENKSDDKKVEETIDAGFSSAEIQAMLFGASTSPSKSQPKIEPKNETPVAVEPLLASSTAGSSMGGNPYYGKNLDQSGREEVKADVIEPMMASSTASSNLGAKPKNSPKKKAVVEPLFEKSSDKITGDKGNKYYSEELDKNRVAAVEGMIIKSSGHPTGGDRGNIHYSKHLDQSAASKDKSKVVEEPLLASSSGGLTASAPKGDKSAHKPVPIEEPLFAATATSVTSAQPVIVPKLKKSVDHPTGDKGNKYHSEKLDKTDKKTAKPIVEPALVRSHDHPTGDKGNPHHAAKLNKSDNGGDSIKPEKSKGVNSVPPGGKPIIEEAIVSKANSGQTSAAPKGKKGKAVVEEAMVAKATSGQTMAAPSANKTPDKQSDKKAVVEPMVSKKTDHVTGDRGNPHHSAKLDQSVSSKAKPAPIVQPLFSKSSSKPTGGKGNPYHSTKLDKEKGKDKSGVIPPVSSRDPPPLDDTKTDSLLFGDDNTVQDTFGTDFKPRAESVEKGDKKDAKKDDKKSSDKKTPSKIDLLADDSLKGKPPPLFGDEEEEDDLDWLS